MPPNCRLIDNRDASCRVALWQQDVEPSAWNAGALQRGRILLRKGFNDSLFSVGREGCLTKILHCRFVASERVTPPLTAQSLPASSSSHQEIEPFFLHFQLEKTPDGERTLASASSHFSFSQAQQASDIKLIRSCQLPNALT